MHFPDQLTRIQTAARTSSFGLRRRLLQEHRSYLFLPLVHGLLLSGLLACESRAQVGDGPEPEPTTTETGREAGVGSVGDASVIVGAPDRDDSVFFSEEDKPLTDASVEAPAVPKFDTIRVGDDGGEIACGLNEVKASQKEVSLLMVMDKSGSMANSQVADGAADGADAGAATVTRWELLRQATQTTVAALGPTVSVGLAVFPLGVGEPIPEDCSENCCSMPPDDGAILVPITQSEDAAERIEDSLAALKPSGGTPTASALAAAFEYYQNGAGQEAPGDRYVLLITDGGPTCNGELVCEADQCTTNLDGNCPEVVGNCCDPEYGEDLTQWCLDTEGPLERIRALRDAGIPTAVMGIPGSGPYARQLDAYALAGGLENSQGDTDYYAVTEQGGLEALKQALHDITQKLITTCTLQLESEPPDINKLNITVDDDVLPQEGADGWELDTSESPPSVVIKGSTCERVEAQGVQAVSIVFGCPTVLRAPK